MKKTFFLLLIPTIAAAQKDSVLSGAYTWKDPGSKTFVLLEGKTHDMSWMQVSAVQFTSAKPTQQTVPANEEHVIIIKSGELQASLKDSTWQLGAGSVLMLLPGEKFALSKNAKDPVQYYLMKYRSKTPVNTNPNTQSIVRDWKNIVYKPNDRGGGRRDFFEVKSPMSKRFEMHVTTLAEGLQSHAPHTHRAEEIVLVLDNDTEMQLADKFYKGGKGTLYYLGSNVSHAIKNIGKGTVTYFAFQFE